MAGGRIACLGSLRSALVGEHAAAARTANGLREALLCYDGRDLVDTARWQRFIAATPFARAWGRKSAPYATTLVDMDELRVRLLYWRPGLVMPFHDHPGFDLVAMRVLGGSPLQEHVKCSLGDALGGPGIGGTTIRRELVVGDVSVIPGSRVEHRVKVKFGDMGTHTLSVELPTTRVSDDAAEAQGAS